MSTVLPDRRCQLDLAKRMWAREQGDITVIGTWWMGDRDEDIEPCLVLVPTHKPLHAPLPPVITLSGAYKWADNPRYAVKMASNYLELLDMTVSLTNVNRVCEIVVSHIRDLFQLPPLPQTGRIVVADATITGENGRTVNAEITRLH